MQLTVGLRETVSLRSGRGEPERLASGWLIGSGQPHLMEGGGAAIVILIDPLSQVGRRLCARLAGADPVPLSEAECERVLAEFERGRLGRWDMQSVRAAVGRTMDLLAPDMVSDDPIDPRVRSAVDFLMLESDQNISLTDLAARAGVSESRLAHLFRRDVGLPMRQYRLALRMEEAVKQISLGLSLADAAQAAGFSDSAHFCRICRRMFGNVPSCLPDFEADDARLRRARRRLKDLRRRDFLC